MNNQSKALSIKRANFFFLISILLALIIPGFFMSTGLGTVVSIVPYAIVTLLAFILCKKDNVSLPEAFNFHKVKPATILLAVVICFATELITSFISNVTNYFFPDLLVLTHDQLYGAGLILNIIGVSLIPGFFEEFVCRGGLLTSYTSTGRFRASVLLTSLLFGLMHGNPTQLFYAFAFGIVLAYLCIASGSIWPGIVVHMLNNFVSVIQDMFETKYGKETVDHATRFIFPDIKTTGSFIYSIVLCILGIIIVCLCIRTVAKNENNEENLRLATKGGDTKTKLVTRSLVIAIVFLVILTIAIGAYQFVAPTFLN